MGGLSAIGVSDLIGFAIGGIACVRGGLHGIDDGGEVAEDVVGVLHLSCARKYRRGAVPEAIVLLIGGVAEGIDLRGQAPFGVVMAVGGLDDALLIGFNAGGGIARGGIGVAFEGRADFFSRDQFVIRVVGIEVFIAEGVCFRKDIAVGIVCRVEGVAMGACCIVDGLFNDLGF